MNSDPTPGDTAICSQCGQPIVFIGPYWDHMGVAKPRHIAMPAEWSTDLSHEIAEAAGDIAYGQRRAERAEAEQARLTSELEGLREAYEQLRQSLISEQRAREMAEADSAEWRRVVYNWRQAGHIVSLDMMRMLDVMRPGRALLIELDAARRVVAAAREWTRNDTSALPINKADVRRIEAVIRAVATYDIAKAREP